MRIELVLALAISVTALAGEAQRGVTPEDYFAIKALSDPQVSPDGKRVAVVVTSVDVKRNRRNTAIYEVSTEPGAEPPRRLSTEGFNAKYPRWSRDGRTLAFLSSRPAESGANAAATGEGPKPQIYLLPMDGGEAQPLTAAKNEVTAFAWSPDDRRLVFVTRTGPSDAVPVADRKSDVRHYRHILYKFNDTGWYDDRRSHLWIVNRQDRAMHQITSGEDWNDTDPQWSPDGTKIAFVSNRTGKEYDDNENTDVWVINADGSGALERVSDHELEDNLPRWSPDGRRIVFAGRVHRREFPKLYVRELGSSQPSRLAVDNLDTIPGELQWGATDHDLLFTAGTRGQTHIFRVDLTKRTAVPVTSGERAVHNYALSAQANLLVYLSNTFEAPDQLYASDLNGGGERCLTDFNAAWRHSVTMASVSRFPYKSTDGLPIDGFLVKPIGWQEGKRYPLVLSVHGGPAGQYGVDWYQEFQVYAARGWAVFFANPRGSTGYGQKFERGIENNWGGMDYVDLMTGLDAVLKANPWIDQNRLGVTGGSYGGFMTNWILGHTTRFKAAVTLRSVSNFISDDGTRDGAYGHRDDFNGGTLFDNFDEYWRASPLRYASAVKTPTLILHSDNDQRVPLEQGEQWFRALQHFGVPSELVIFPRENHNLTRTGEPKHLVESLNWQCWWFRKYLDGDATAKAPDSL
jgi:dipeptidyl aminopeptidase/acylaminoacyl peptidase